MATPRERVGELHHKESLNLNVPTPAVAASAQSVLYRVERHIDEPIGAASALLVDANPLSR